MRQDKERCLNTVRNEMRHIFSFPVHNFSLRWAGGNVLLLIAMRRNERVIIRPLISEGIELSIELSTTVLIWVRHISRWSCWKALMSV